MKKIIALLKLTRFKEFTFFVIVTTLLGVASAHGEFGWQFVGVLVANWLAVMFAFMINDVEDADDDALNPKKINRNPVSAGDLNPRTATFASFLVAGASAMIYSLLGFWPFVLGIISLILGWIYSWRMIRLKNMAFFDLLSHCMMLAGLQFLPGYLAFDNRPQSFIWLFPFASVVAISLYGELFNELRDLDGDLKAGLRHTGAKLGARPTYWLMMSVLAIGVACAFVTIFLLDIIPTWVVILLFAVALALTVGPAILVRRNQDKIELHEFIPKADRDRGCVCAWLTVRVSVGLGHGGSGHFIPGRPLCQHAVELQVLLEFLSSTISPAFKRGFLRSISINRVCQTPHSLLFCFHFQPFDQFQQLAEALDFDDPGQNFGRIEMFVGPGGLIGNINGLTAQGQYRLDVGTQRISNHDHMARLDLVFLEQSAVILGGFIGDNFDIAEVAGQARTGDLIGLLEEIAFRDQH